MYVYCDGGPAVSHSPGAQCGDGLYAALPMGTKAYKSYRMSFFEKVKMQKVSCKGSV